MIATTERPSLTLQYGAFRYDLGEFTKALETYGMRAVPMDDGLIAVFDTEDGSFMGVAPVRLN